jgi:eukaryotic-like serine/threonine-protein kinase
VDGSGTPEKLFDLDTYGYDGSLSPDGRAFVLTSRLDAGADLWWVDLAGDRKRHSVGEGIKVARSPTVSPDGRWLAYSSLKSGRREIYVRPFRANGAELQVSLDGGEYPVWSRDGHTLHYLEGARLIAVSVSTGERFRVEGRRTLREDQYTVGATTGATSRPPYSFSPDGQRFVAVSRVDNDARLVVITNWLAELRKNR